MTTTEHLDKILAKIDRLLEMAGNRSRGSWEVKPLEAGASYLRIRGTALGGRFKIANVLQPVPFGEFASEDRLTQANAAFISSCAGNAEAGWRATKAAIEHLIYYEDHVHSYAHRDSLALLRNSILAAWPVELLD